MSRAVLTKHPAHPMDVAALAKSGPPSSSSLPGANERAKFSLVAADHFPRKSSRKLRRLAWRRRRHRQQLFRRPGLFLGVAILAAAALVEKAEADEYLPSSNSAAHVALATPYAGDVFAFYATFKGTTFFQGSGVRYSDKEALMTGHQVFGSAGQVTDGFAVFGNFAGTDINNFASVINSPGVISVVQISNITPYPGYSYAHNQDFTTPDLSKGAFGVTISGTPVANLGPNLTLTGAPIGSTLTGVGYDRWGPSETTLNEADGQLRAHLAYLTNVDTTIASNVSPIYNIAAGYSDRFPGATLRGMDGIDAPYGSGGGQFLSPTELLGINDSVAGSGVGLGQTYANNLLQNEERAFVSSGVPEPDATKFLLMGTVLYLLLSRHSHAGRSKAFFACETDESSNVALG